MRHKLHLAPMLVPSIPSWSFLQRCFLCQRELTEGMDIYMYRSVQFATYKLRHSCMHVSVMMSCILWLLTMAYGCACNRGDRAFCSKSCRCRHMTEDDSSAIDSGRVTAPDRFHRSGSCYKATPSVYFFLECRQVLG